MEYIACNILKKVCEGRLIVKDALKIGETKKDIINALIACCIVFSVATMISSGWQLISGFETDTNIHILVRGLVVLIGVGFFQTFHIIKIENPIIYTIVHYCVTMGLVFATIWCFGFFCELAEHAYRDIFLNYSIGYIVVSACVKAIKKKKQF